MLHEVTKEMEAFVGAVREARHSGSQGRIESASCARVSLEEASGQMRDAARGLPEDYAR